VLGTPALLINGRVKSVGKVPAKSKIIEWFKEAEEREGSKNKEYLGEKSWKSKY